MEIFLAVFYLAAAVILLYCIYILLYSLLFGAPYAATRKERMKKMIQMLELKKGDNFADLGSGDGRFVILAAKKGVRASGYELNPILVFYSRYKINKAGLSHTAKIYRRSYWNVSLGEYNKISVFGIKHIMPFLERKLRRELKKESKVVSNHFKFPKWKESRRVKNLYLYET